MPIDDQTQARGYEKLLKEVNDGDGVVSIGMGQLREIHGAGKLGNNVVANMSEKLKSYGLGHMPTALPTYQWHTVLIYRNGTSVAQLIDALNTVTQESAGVVRGFIHAGNEDRAIITRIREMVCD